MNAILEIRHSSREKRRQMLAFVFVFSGRPLMDLILRDEGWERLFLIDSMYGLAAIVLMWVLLNRQFIRVNSEGIIYRRWFTLYNILWSDVESYFPDWKFGLEDFLFSSYGFQNL